MKTLKEKDKQSFYGYIGREQNFYIQPSRMYLIQIR